MQDGVAERLDLAGVHIAKLHADLFALNVLGVLLGVVAADLAAEQRVERAAVDLTDDVLTRQTALIAEELQTPLGGLIRDVEVGLHHALAAVFQPQHDHGRVLDLIVERQRVVERRDLLDARAGDVLHEVDAVHAHVHHGAAAAVFLALTPVARHIGIPAGELRVAGDDLADLAVGDRLFHRLHIRAETHHETGGDLHALALAIGDDLLALFRGHGEGFFNEDVLACVRSGHRLPRVQNNGRRDVNCVDLRVGEQRRLVIIRTLAAPLGAAFFCQLHVDLHHSDQFGVIRQHHARDRPTVCDAARADHAPTNLFHSEAPFIFG